MAIDINKGILYGNSIGVSYSSILDMPMLSVEDIKENLVTKFFNLPDESPIIYNGITFKRIEITFRYKDIELTRSSVDRVLNRSTFNFGEEITFNHGISQNVFCDSLIDQYHIIFNKNLLFERIIKTQIESIEQEIENIDIRREKLFLNKEKLLKV